LTFSADGTVVAANMLAGTRQTADYDPFDKPTLPWGVGGWDVRPATDGHFGGVDIGTSDGEVDLEARGNPSHPTLFAFIGDPDDDDEYVFTKF
jgi:hypothetical protein